MSLRTSDRLFFLSWKKLLLIPGIWVLCVVLHNLVYTLFRPLFEPGGDEPFFFLLAVVVIPLYTAACVLYSVVRVFMKFASRSRSS